MKRIIPVFASLLFAACGLFYFSTQEKPLVGGLKVPGGASEENTERRSEWERMRLADPATGQIPAGIGFLERRYAATLPQAVAERGGNGMWMSRGPWNVGGRTRALAIDVANENRILAGGVSGGMWLSEDGGQTWARKTPLNAHPGVTSIAQDTRPGKTNIWYYTSGELYGASATDPSGYAYYLGDGLFKSTDGGNTWAPIASTSGGNPHEFTNVWQGVWRIATDPSSAQDEVYAATYGVIYRSVNGGTSWTVVRGPGQNQPYSYYTDVAVTPTGVVYAALSSDGVPKGIFRSTNGTTWTSITPGFMPNVYNRIVIGINPSNENEVYFFGATPGSGLYTNYIGSDNWTSLFKYTYLSGDGSGAGGQWEDRSLNLPSTGTEFDQCAIQGGYDVLVRPQPGSNTVIIGGTNLWRSTDGFATPDNTTKIGGYKIGTSFPFFELYPNHHPDLHEAVFLPSNPNVMITGSDGGIHRTEDCLAPFVEWSYLNDSYITSQFYTAIIDKNAPGDNTLLGGLQDNGNFFVNSPDPKAPWRQTVNGDGGYGAIAPGKAFYALSVQSNGIKVVKCALDNSGNITGFRRVDPIGPIGDDYMFINPLVLDPNDPNLLYLPAGNKVYRQSQLASIPLTGEWDPISQGWTQFPDTIIGGAFSAISVSETAPTNRLYLGSSNNKIFRVDNANTGTPSFTALPSPDTSSIAYINCLAIDPTNANRVVLVYTNYKMYSLYLSEDAGASWKKVGGNLETSLDGLGAGPSPRWVSMLPLDNGTIKYFCGTSVGLYSADSLVLHASGQPGTVWTLESPNEIGSSVVDYVDVRRSDGLVVAATHSNGMFSANFGTGSGSHEPKNTVSVRVSPNPVREVATFSIAGQNLDNTTVRLFDLKGNLLREESLAGEKGVLQLNNLPAGIYVWELRGKGWRKSGKLVKE
ncbi:MAG: T9SS type A sorting domain-containing protein [Phycisphaerae bacterium]|nr:T9SS type A sorting domain-containing protein [Saprospiraceae bacterium]